MTELSLDLRALEHAVKHGVPAKRAVLDLIDRVRKDEAEIERSHSAEMREHYASQAERHQLEQRIAKLEGGLNEIAHHPGWDLLDVNYSKADVVDAFRKMALAALETANA
jgi:hypothetical protein